MNVFDQVVDKIDASVEESHSTHAFYMFEPWDVKKRPDWFHEVMRSDNVDVYDEVVLRHIGADPHDFQTGYMISTAFMRCLLAGSQVGKSHCPKIESSIMLTGEVPYSLRYPKGYDTKVKRVISTENILRFGRRDSSTGKLIDFKTDERQPEGWDEWDCGTIKGAGVYPSEKIAPPGEQIWIGTYKEAFTNYWWPELVENKESGIPDFLIDKTKGNNGLNKTDNIIHLLRDGRIVIITYEQGYQRFEAQMAWSYIGDEEMLDRRIFDAAQQHCKYMSLVFTPYSGITYMRDIIFPKTLSRDKRVFHATQYDSPYQQREDIEIRKKDMEPWTIGARVYGLPTEVTGKPYFDRMKITGWINKFDIGYEMTVFSPEQPYFGIRTRPELTNRSGLLDTPIRSDAISTDDLCSTWRVYEERQPGAAYLMTVDPAEGAATPEAAADVCAAMIFRKNDDPEGKPVIVASLRSTLETIPFAKVCSYALRYWNNAVLAAETKRGSSNATFTSELRDWPYWYKFTSVQDTTGRPRQQIGFDPNSASRPAIFDLITDWVNGFGTTQYPLIPDRPLLIELQAAIVGKNNRCDHPSKGTLDTAVCFGIALYVFKNSPDQVRCNAKAPPPKPRVDRHAGRNAGKPNCGMSMMGYGRKQHG